MCPASWLLPVPGRQVTHESKSRAGCPGAFVCSSVGLRLSYAHTAWHDAGGVTGKSLSCPLWLPLDAGDWCGGSSGPLYVQEVAGGWASVPGVLHA